MPTHAPECVRGCVSKASRYLPSALIEPFRNPKHYYAQTQTHIESKAWRRYLSLARCSRLHCQMNHLQITGVAIAGEENNTAAPAASGREREL